MIGLGAGEGTSGVGVGESLSPESPDSLASGLGAPPPLDADSGLVTMARSADLATGADVTGSDLTLVFVLIPGGTRICVGFRVVVVIGGGSRGRVVRTVGT